MSTLSQRQAYLAHWQTVNAMACNICGLKPVDESEWIAADIAANVNKPAKAHQRDEAAALAMQIDYFSKTECDA